jgi:glyoxylase-like metal-dependent hydrolase (beta-lactamase superfamily II)
MLHLITLPTPFAIGPVNVYLAEGDPLTLIDTGPKWDASREALEAGLARHGYRVEDLRRLIITHHHADHMGLAAEIVARSGAELLTHPYNVPWMRDYLAHRGHYRPFFQQIWAAAGVPADVMAAMDASGRDIARWIDPATPTGTLAEGATITLADAEWRVYHTPGHAGGLICLWEPYSATLLANDHILKDISSNPTLEPPPANGLTGPAERPKRLIEYLHHLQRMAAVRPARALPGHGEIVTDVAGLVKHRLAFHTRRKERLLQMLAGCPQTLWELVQAMFGERLTRGMDWFLGCSEVLGHLDLLQADGAAEPVPAAGLVRWTVV